MENKASLMENKIPLMENKIVKNTHPLVVCICPTYNRRLFLPKLIHLFNSQTYPKNRLKLIILDDSDESNEDLIINNENINYIYKKEKMTLGKKRNMLNTLALDMEADYIACLDDDDYYPPEKISYTIRMMIAHKSIISGTSKVYVYFTNLDKIYIFGPHGNSHATNGTFVYHSKFITNEGNLRLYNEELNKGEEKEFLENFTIPILQLDPLQVIVCIAHNTNTVNKYDLIKKGSEFNQKIKKLIKDKHMLEFYNNMENK